jgi:hypothetical protein
MRPRLTTTERGYGALWRTLAPGAAAGIGLALMTCGIGRSALLHLRGVPWARIGEFVGQRSLSVTADTYSHVVTDERELDYAAMLT